MAEIRRTLIPQFTIRWILALTTIMALVSWVIAQAVRGEAWAGGVFVFLSILAFAFVVYAAVFGGVLTFAENISRFKKRREARKSQAIDQNPIANPPAAKTAGAILLAACLALSAEKAFAVSGGALTLPAQGPGLPPNRCGLTLTLDTSWVDGYGYRPVRVEVKSTSGPLTADRVLKIRFRPMIGYSRNDSVNAIQTLEIPAGASSAKMTVSVPQFGQWGMFALETTEDGSVVKELSLPDESAFASWSGTDKGDFASPVTLLLSGSNTTLGTSMMSGGSFGELLSVNGQSGAFPINGTGPMAVGSSVSGFGGGVPTLNDLPTKWIDYSEFDLIVTSLGQLEGLAVGSPEQWQAIRDWQHNGGTLIVYGVGDRWEKLEELEDLLAEKEKGKATAKNSKGGNSDSSKTTANAKEKTNDTNGLLARGWQLPKKSLKGRQLEGLNSTTVYNPDGSVQQLQFDGGGTDAEQPSSDPSAGSSGKGSTDSAGNQSGGSTDSKDLEAEAAEVKRKAQADLVAADKAPFIMRNSGMGLVVAIRADGNFSGNKFAWAWLYNSIGAQRWQWYQRHGVSMYQDNGDVWNFLIPGVGLAPVVQFQVLISLFVIAIGPVNYYLLRRWGKLNLTVVIVPVAAVVITGALFVYALVADGLGVRVRARSFTHINQRTGETTCWARLSYYPGLTHRNGLEFDDRTIVLPMEDHPSNMETQPPRVVEWTHTDPSNASSPLVQKLPSGWLYSRTPTQLVTSRIRTTTARLDVKNPAGGQPGNAAMPEVTNHLGTAIQWLLVVDENGGTYLSEDIAPDAIAKLTKVESQADALQKLQPIVGENQPHLPGIMTNGHRGIFGINQQQNYYRGNMSRWRYRYANYNAGNNGVSPAGQGSGLMERSLGELEGTLLNNELPPRSYIAIVELSPEVQLGLSEAVPEASFHLIRGEW